EMAMTLMPSLYFLRISMIVSRPSFLGMMMSVMIRFGGASFSRISRPCAPSIASITSKPQSSRFSQIVSRTASSSSMTSMRAFELMVHASFLCIEDLPHFGGQFALAVGFADKVRADFHFIIGDRLLRVAGGIEDAQLGIIFLRLFRKLDAVHASRHQQV